MPPCSSSTTAPSAHGVKPSFTTKTSSRRPALQTSFAVPEPLNRRSSFYFGYGTGSVTLELGGIFSGSTKVGDRFTWVEKTDGSSYLNSGYAVIDDEVRWGDTVGGRARLTYNGASLRWYGQGSLMGPVADGGYNYATLLTGWAVKESGRGNHWAVSTGVSTRAGFFEIAPQFLYQQPIIPANPKIDDFYNRITFIIRLCAHATLSTIPLSCAITGRP